MNLPFSFDPAQLPEYVGLALVHFIWQGALLAAVLGLALLWIPRRAAALRHNLACATLFLLLLAPPSTLVWILATTPTPQQTVVANTDPKGANPGTLPSRISPESTRITLEDTRWLPWVSVLWVAGVFAFSLRWVRGCWHVHRLRTQDTHAVSPEWLDRFEMLCSCMEIKIKVRLLESTRIAGPIVIGWLRPVVLMPMGLLSGMPTTQVESLLLHELAHIRGNDYLINLIARFAETVLFYHPAVWWVVRHIELEREKRCDDAVRDAMGEGQSLAEALLSLCEREVDPSPMTLAAAGSSVGDRVRRLADQEEASPAPAGRRRWGWMLLLLALVVGAGLIVPNIRSSYIYQAQAHIRIEQFSKVTSGQGSYDPYQILTWMEVLRSEQVLRDVVKRGELIESWKLSEAECIQKLRSRSDIRQYRSTSLLEVRCADEDPEMASELANWYTSAIAGFFNEKRDEEWQRKRVLDSRRSSDLEQQILEISAHLAALKARPAEPEPGKVEMLTDKLELLRDLKREDERRKFQEMDNDTKAVGVAVETINSATPQKRRVFWRRSE